MSIRKQAGLVAVLLAVGLGTGCEQGNRPKTVKVFGRVTLNGGDWPGPGDCLVMFHTRKPADGYIGRPGQAQFDQHGDFTAGTYEADDGLVPGEYEVQVIYEKRRPMTGEDAAPELLIKGQDRLIVPADNDTPIEYQFDVRSKIRK